MKPVDFLGGDISVGSVVVWVYNMPVRGGSKPRLAVGTVETIKPKTLMIKAISVQDSEESNGSIIRARQKLVVVIDEDTSVRVAIKKLAL